MVVHFNRTGAAEIGSAGVSGQEHAQFQTAVGHLRPDLDTATINSNMKTGTEETNADFKASGKAGADAQTGGGYAQASAGASAPAQAGDGKNLSHSAGPPSASIWWIRL